MTRKRRSRTADPEDYFSFVEEPVRRKRRLPFEDDLLNDENTDEEESPPPRPVKSEPEKPKKRERSRRLIDELPNEIPILTKDDLLLHQSQDKEGSEKHHMTTWLNLCLPPDYYSGSARNKLAAAIMDVTWSTWGYNGIGPSFIPLDDQAAIWNSALKKLGYPVSPHVCLVLGAKRRKKEG